MVATKFDCKYTEISVVLNHKVDELLVDIVTQVRQVTAKRAERKKRSDGAICPEEGNCMQQVAREILDKFLRKHKTECLSDDM